MSIYLTIPAREPADPGVIEYAPLTQAERAQVDVIYLQNLIRLREANRHPMFGRRKYRDAPGRVA